MEWKVIVASEEGTRRSCVALPGLCPLVGANAPGVASWLHVFGPFSWRAKGQVLLGYSRLQRQVRKVWIDRDALQARNLNF